MDFNYSRSDEFCQSNVRASTGVPDSEYSRIKFPLGFSNARRIGDYLNHPIDSILKDHEEPSFTSNRDFNNMAHDVHKEDSEKLISKIVVDVGNRNPIETLQVNQNAGPQKGKPKFPMYRNEKKKKEKTKPVPINREDFKGYITRICREDRTKKFINPLTGSLNITESEEDDWDDFEAIYMKYKKKPCYDEQLDNITLNYRSSRYENLDGVVLTNEDAKIYELLFTSGIHRQYPDTAFQWQKYLKRTLVNAVVGSKSHLQEYFRFELPLQLSELKDLRPMDYLKRFVNISELRQYVYEKHFKSIQFRCKDTQKLYCLVKDTQKCLLKILIDSFSKEDFKFIKDILLLEDAQALYEWEFFLICAVTERLFFLKNTDAITNESYLVLAGNVEKADFSNLKYRMKGAELTPELSTFFDYLLESIELDPRDYGKFDYSESR